MHPKTTNVSTLHVTDLAPAGAEEISAALRELLADVFALYVKTKNFHWHMNGRHFRDFHLMLDDQSDQLFAMIDPVAERIPAGFPFSSIVGMELSYPQARRHVPSFDRGYLAPPATPGQRPARSRGRGNAQGAPLE